MRPRVDLIKDIHMLYAPQYGRTFKSDQSIQIRAINMIRARPDGAVFPVRRYLFPISIHPSLKSRYPLLTLGGVA